MVVRLSLCGNHIQCHIRYIDVLATMHDRNRICEDFPFLSVIHSIFIRIKFALKMKYLLICLNFAIKGIQQLVVVIVSNNIKSIVFINFLCTPVYVCVRQNV